VKPARRRRWRARLRPTLKYALLIALASGAVYGGASAVLHASALQIDRFAVRGNAQLERGGWRALGIRGRNIL
jgi:hypothetical protein